MDEITIPRKWFERLAELAKEASEYSKNHHSLDIVNLCALIGFASSVETILKTHPKEAAKEVNIYCVCRVPNKGIVSDSNTTASICMTCGKEIEE